MNTNVALLLGMLAGSLGGAVALQTFLGRTGGTRRPAVHRSTTTADGFHRSVPGYSDPSGTDMISVKSPTGGARGSTPKASERHRP